MTDSLSDLFKQAQQLQSELMKKQGELKEIEVTGRSGAGLVNITMNAQHEVKNIQLDDTLFSESKEVLEDLLVAAINDAVGKIQKETKSAMADVRSGLKLPDGFKFPF